MQMQNPLENLLIKTPGFHPPNLFHQMQLKLAMLLNNQKYELRYRRPWKRRNRATHHMQTKII
jgi:hypothetical protein